MTEGKTRGVFVGRRRERKGGGPPSRQATCCTLTRHLPVPRPAHSSSCSGTGGPSIATPSSMRSLSAFEMRLGL